MLCRICGEQKSEAEFHPSNWKGAITRSKCRKCLGDYQSERYYNGGLKKRMETKRQLRIKAVNAIKSARGCMKCGEVHPACLDFHHRDPMQKMHSIGVLAAHTTKLDRVLAEIEKCDVLCSNCHRKLHWQQKRPRKPKQKPQQRVEAEALRLA